MWKKKRKTAEETAPAEIKKKRKRRGRLKKTAVIVSAAVILGAAAAGAAYAKKAKAAKAPAEAVKTAVVERRDITSELSSSGTISPKDTYDITSLVEGEVISADFEEGDQVEKGQVLYQIDTSSMESELNNASNSLTRSQDSLRSAQADYDEAVGKYGGNTYKSTDTGYIKTLYIKAGDKVGANTKIADIYDDKTMKIRLPFLSAEAANIGVGNEGILTLTDTGEQLPGVVTAVSSMEEALTGGRLVRYVTMQVANPGGLTTQTAAVAMIGEFSCSVEAVFEPAVDTVMSADLSGSVDVEAMLVSEGDYVSKGTPVFRMESRSAEKLVRTYKEALDKAKDSVESAQNKLENTENNFEDYTITAPISGQVISKNVKVGDKVAKNSNGSTTMAVIYDLSSYTFEMSVDELDVKNVKVGQEVKITADAVNGKTFNGTVTNVSLESSYDNGVTNYPVTVTLADGIEELLPGMNVDGVIILEEAQQVLSVPADALMRGNRVYVKDDSAGEQEQQGNVPAGFKAVEVETGLISDDYVEIKSGLSEGDEVYVSESTVSSGNNNMTMPGGGMPGGMPPGGGSGGYNNRSGGGSGGGNSNRR